MINDLDIVQWEYLLSPEFELINSAGKPLTGGWIEVYLHGTRDKYYCASDFDGTLHPFKIPLDSIGANVVLADPNNAYDVYVYNKFGSLIMSRYNVKCQGSGGSSTYVGDKLYYGQYRASNVTTIANLRRNKGNINITDDGYLKLKSGMSYHITVRGSFTVDDPANEDTTLNYIEYTSVNPIKIDIDETKEGPQYFELSYDIYRLQEDMDYQVAFAQSNGMVTDLIVEVHSLSNLATSATGGDQEYEAGWGIDITNNVVSVDPSIFEDYTYTAGDYISIDENNVISVTGINPADFATHEEVHEATVTAIELVTGLIPEEQVQSDWNETDTEDPAYIQNKPDLDIYATHDEVNNVSGKIIETVNNVSGVLHEEVMEVSGSIIHYQGASGINVEGDTISLEEPLYIEAGSGINFTSEGDTITINADPVDLSDYVTHIELEEAISAVTGIGDYGQFYATNISGAATMARTKGTIDVTNDGKIMLKKGSSYHVTMRGRYNQTTASNTLSTLSLIEYITNNSISVNVDTTITDSQYFEISYDLYKLNSDTNYYVFFNVPAGKINDLFVEIHAIGSVGAGVSGGAGTEYDAGWGIQILNNVISVDPSILNDYTTNGDVYNSTVSAINLVTGMIPEAQVQSDWTEADDTDPAYIKNKPEEYNLVAGDNITIDVSGTNIVISSEGGIASGASGCNVEFVNILDYQGQITDREPGAQTTYTGGTALANAMRNIMLRGHMPFLVYGTQFVNSEVFTPIWLDTREFAPGTNGGYSCVPLTGHEFFFKNPVTSFVTTKIVIDALNDKISDFIVSADTVATVGRGLTVDYFGAGDPWVWYEGYGPTPPASAATTPGLCRIEIASSIPDVTQVQTMIDTSVSGIPTTEYTAGTGVDITSGVISVDNTVAMKTDLPVISLNGSDQVTAIDGHTLAGGGSADSDIFIVSVYSTAWDGSTYNNTIDTTLTTPYSDVLAAYNQGKTLICRYYVYNSSSQIYELRSVINFSQMSNSGTAFQFIGRASGMVILRVDYSSTRIDALHTSAQADWNNTYNGEPGYIRNKPSIPVVELNSSNQVTAIDGHTIAGGGGGGSSYTAGTGIDITNDVISVDNTVAMKTDLPAPISGASGITVEDSVVSLDNPIGLVAGNNITIEVSGVSAIISSTGGGGTQVQADWTETDTSDPSYIQNKPTEKNLVAGTNVTITESNDEVTIETTEIASGLQLVAGPGIVFTVSGNNLVANAEVGNWTEVTNEITKSTTLIQGGAWYFYYNKELKLIHIIGEILVSGAGDVYELPVKYRPMKRFVINNPTGAYFIDYNNDTGKFVSRSGTNGYFSMTSTLVCSGE